jgi:chromosome segregation ATPase
VFDRESHLKKNMQRCEDLGKQNKSLLDSLDRLQKIMEGHITVIEDKNKTIAELTSKYEDSENNLDQAMQTLNDLKDAEKQKN